MVNIINFYNQIGAGPKNIALNFISELTKLNNLSDEFIVIVPDIQEYSLLADSLNVSFLKAPKFNFIILKILYRVYLDLIVIPRLTYSYKVKKILSFGNFFISPVAINKTVLLHHPYLYDDFLLAKMPLLSLLIEKVKRFVFLITLNNVDAVVVQSDYMSKVFKKKWKKFHGAVHVIENPISNRFKKNSTEKIKDFISSRKDSLGNKIVLLYVSRFYPHKNHDFLISLSHELTTLNLSFRILVTIDPDIKSANNFLSCIQSNNLPIINIGEISQESLQHYYENAHLFIFPSEAETFGNSLIEAMSYGLPVVVPDLGYAHSVVGDSGLYYKNNDSKDCASKIMGLLSNTESYVLCSNKMLKRFSFFLRANDWVKKYLSII